MAKVDALVESDKPIRVHWTGCPNSCGQVQAADIGLMGAPAKREIGGKMKAVAGANIFVGGTIGEGGHLAMEPSLKGIPVDDEEEIAKVLGPRGMKASARVGGRSEGCLSTLAEE